MARVAARHNTWQFVTLARQLLPADVAAGALAGRSSDLADLSFTAEVSLFA